jgi:peroxidase
MLAFASSSALQAQSVEYRTTRGAGNNVAHRDWGQADTRLLRGPSGPDYGDGVSSMAGAARPSPRVVSNALFSQTQPIFSIVGHSDYIWAWGQFLDHDIAFTPGTEEREPIPVPPGDPFFDPRGTGSQVIPFRRSTFDPLTGTGITNPRQQRNLITAYIDGSTVYGSDADRASWSRTHIGGRLKVRSTVHGDLLPYNDGTMFNVMCSLSVAADVTEGSAAGIRSPAFPLTSPAPGI